MAAPSAPGEERPQVPASRLSALAAVLSFYLDAATLISVAIALPIWRDAYALDVWQVGWVTGGLALAVAAGALGGGWLADRLGRGRVFTYDLLVFVAGALVVATAGDAAALMAGVLLLGLATGVDIPVALTVVADAAPRRRSQLTGLTQVVWILAVLITFGLGVLVADRGLSGTQLLMAHLVVLAVFTLGLRLLVMVRRDRPAARSALVSRETRTRPARRMLITPEIRGPLLLVGGFFLFWNVASTTMGSYLTYFLVTVTGMDQRSATTLTLTTVVVALLMAVLFVRLADSRWRDRLFVAALVGQVAAFGTGALTGGTTLGAMVTVGVLYSLSSVFAGEAIFKVWAQRLFPDDLRATALGMSYGVARLAAAAFLIVVPELIEISPALTMAILTGCVVVSGGLGLVIVRHPDFTDRLQTQEARGVRQG